MEFPIFKYHQNPIENNAFEKSDLACTCCNKTTGYIYTLPIYTEIDTEDLVICPWCLSSGSAAKKYRATFNDTYLVEKSLSSSDNDEILHRTPSYSTWQDFDWMIHCGQPAIFIGSADKSSIKQISNESLAVLLQENDLEDDEVDEIISGYIAHESPMLYQHKCSKCDLTLYTMEYS